MTRLLSTLTLGALAVGITLANPATSHAQSFGVRLDVGRTHIDVGTGIYTLPRVYSSYPRYEYLYPSGYAHRHHHHHAFYPPPVVVIPEPYYLAPAYPIRTEVLLPSGTRVFVRP